MSHYRSDLRRAVKLAFAVSEYFAPMQKMSAWAQSVDWETLPVLGIATPRETKDQDALDSAERAVTLIAVLKRAGDDELEDALDRDSAQVEATALQAIRQHGWGALLETTDIDLAGSAERRVGTLTMTFRAVLQTPEPLNP